MDNKPDTVEPTPQEVSLTTTQGRETRRTESTAERGTLGFWQEKITADYSRIEKEWQEAVKSNNSRGVQRLERMLEKLGFQQRQLWRIEYEQDNAYSERHFPHLGPDDMLTEEQAAERNRSVLSTSSSDVMKRLDEMVDFGEKVYKEDFGGIDIRGLPEAKRLEAEDLSKSIDWTADLSNRILTQS